jgi:hypothetical protein
MGNGLTIDTVRNVLYSTNEGCPNENAFLLQSNYVPAGSFVPGAGVIMQIDPVSGQSIIAVDGLNSADGAQVCEMTPLCLIRRLILRK